jgi:hypothetical protein
LQPQQHPGQIYLSGAFSFRGYDTTNGFSTTSDAAINANADEAFTATAHGTRIVFYGTPIGTKGFQEWMRMTNGNMGIGATGPTQKLEVNGGIRINTATAKPTCSSTVRGTFWATQGAAGVQDTVEVCAKDAADAYAWRTIY